MAEQVGNVLNNAIEGLKKMIDVDSVIGNPIKISEEVTVIPVSKVSLGFVSGGTEFGGSKENFGGGAGGGVKISPLAFLVINGQNVRIMSVSGTPDKYDKVVNLVPEMVDKLIGLFKKDNNEGDLSL